MKKSRTKITLPPCGIFVGSGVYPMSQGYLLSTLYAHQSWAPQSYSPQEMIDKIVEDNQGNMAQLWGISRGSAPATVAKWQYALDEVGIDVPEPDWEHGKNLKVSECQEIQEHAERDGAGLVRFIENAAKKGIYTMMIYAKANQHWSHKLGDVGEYYLGYDFGERHSFRLDDANLRGKQLEDVTLKVLADDLVDQVRQHVEERHEKGWGNIIATSANFYIDYEVIAGTDIPLMEDFAFEHLGVATALSRGLYRQFDLPLWGSHIAHEHYSYIPNSSEHKWNLLKASMYQKYMSGSKVILIESGNWFVEAAKCMDSPKFEFPRVSLKPTDHRSIKSDPTTFVPYVNEAQKYFSRMDYTSTVPRRYRKEISEFYDFVKANGTPQGQPESTVAIAKGNYDLGGIRFNPNTAIAGAYALAEEKPAWFMGQPERGWNIANRVFFPRPSVIEPYENSFLSGSPFGQVDIVSFAEDAISSDFLSAHYKALLFAGWNTSSEKQYETMKQYVKNGGIMFISIPQLSTNLTRNYTNYTVNDLVHGGDFSELCGVKVLSRGIRMYWATAPYDNEELGFKYPHRFGILTTCMGDIQITDNNIDILAVDDEQGLPLVLRHQYGKGCVYFLNSWAYPGAFDQDFGPGSTRNSPGLVGMIYRHIAKRARGNVFITDDQQEPGTECEYINVSYFPEAKKTCLFNIDYQKEHTFFLHSSETTKRTTLQAGEFRTIEMEEK